MNMRDAMYETSYALIARDERREELRAAALRGLGPFWPTNRHEKATDAPTFDGEQEIPLILAIRDALARAATDAELGRMVRVQVEGEVERYVREMTEGGC